MRRVYAALAVAALIAGCSRHRSDAEPSRSGPRAPQMNSTCAQEILFEHGRPMPPIAPRRPLLPRARSPQEWATFDRDYARYHAERYRYDMTMRIVRDKVALRCGTPAGGASA